MMMLITGALAMPEGFTPTKVIPYKQVGDVELKLHVFLPENHCEGKRSPAIVFFFGGGWNGGTPGQFYPHAAYLASRGMVAIAAEYRIKSVHGTPASTCVKDGKSAIRWVREHAAELGINPDKVAAGGGSAGGHVAAATATAEGFNEEGENQDTSCIPNALILFNPVYDNGPGGFAHDRVKEYWEDFSPLHNLSKSTPPAIVFLGTEDHLVPVATAKAFQQRMEDLGVRSDLHLYEGQGHAFFNYKDLEYFNKTVIEMDKFLTSLDYLEGSPTIQVE